MLAEPEPLLNLLNGMMEEAKALILKKDKEDV
jgi:hypothetical protein